MSEITSLSQKVRRAVHELEPANADDLLKMANEFDNVSARFARGECEAPELLGAWARLRRAYCELTGESLV